MFQYTLNKTTQKNCYGKQQYLYYSLNWHANSVDEWNLLNK